jgi:hypothetical protein
VDSQWRDSFGTTRSIALYSHFLDRGEQSRKRVDVGVMNSTAPTVVPTTAPTVVPLIIDGTIQLMSDFHALLSETKGLTYDPWALPTATALDNATLWGQMVECDDPMTTDRCFVKYMSSGLERYIVYDQYNECAQSWILLPGFNLLEQKFLIGAPRP